MKLIIMEVILAPGPMYCPVDILFPANVGLHN